jgi:hypothetical protein
MIYWPSSFQTYLNTDNFSYSKGSTVIRTEMDIGPKKVRRRFTKSIDAISCTFTIPNTLFTDFMTFFDTTLNGGTYQFRYNHPFTGIESSFRFIGEPKLSPMGNTYSRVTMDWEVMP